MGFLVAIAWILAITTMAINVQVIADICFRLWTLGCNNWFHDLCSGRLTRRSQQSNHKHGSFRSSSKSWASPHASACLSSNFSSPLVSPAPTRFCKPEANCVRYMVDAYLLNLWAELTWQCHRGIHYLYKLGFFERTIFKGYAYLDRY
ncbi:hypothetical protein CY34DRAFT_567946 [Suillus luteus UH-Slu-Lm8-n1]|uniref:Uncharacterized protein n=1 Tax=Suillus luteus UH-Slu-Lm8-n1 TaxID=930992 RepID=A0A0D0BPJ7_9AGAM|nr:hypothetical protein CY34DRAFT_567946 [Suillus luteus UH-Slu-Lm8-n1]